jgi:hypothetical protein
MIENYLKSTQSISNKQKMKTLTETDQKCALVIEILKGGLLFLTI